MEKVVRVKMKNAGISPQKARLIADLVRGMKVAQAIDTLSVLNKRGSITFKKLLVSASASASNMYNSKLEDLKISKLTVDEGTKMPKVRFASRTRVSRLIKRRSHINLEVVSK